MPRTVPRLRLTGIASVRNRYIDADAIAQAKPSSDDYPRTIFQFLGPLSRNYLNDAGATDTHPRTERAGRESGLWPSARSGHSSWVDPGANGLGRLYIFGGIGFSPHGASVHVSLSVLRLAHRVMSRDR